MRKLKGKLHLNSPRSEDETQNGNPEVPKVANLETSKPTEDEGWTGLALVDILSVIYGLLIVSMSIVLPLTLLLIPEFSYNQNGKYLTVFHFYVYLVALVALCYMFIACRRLRRQDKVTHQTLGEVSQPEGQEAPPIYEGDEEVNFFLRMGLVAFCIGGGLMEGFRIISFAEGDSARMLHCFGRAYMVLSVIRLIFIIFQTYSIFKFHKIVINFQHAIMKMCTMHLLATNLSTWSLSVYLEAVESYHHAEALRSGHHKRAAIPEEHKHSNGTDSTASISCKIYPDTLSTVAAPYLFPFIIEYSLLAGAILYNIYSRIGPEEYEEIKERIEEKKQKENQPTESETETEHHASPVNSASCSKAHTGLFLGTTVFILLAIASCFFLYYKTKVGSGRIIGMIHINSSIVVNLISILAIVLAFWKTSKLAFTAYLHSALDQNLLVYALFGYYVLLCLMALASLSQTNRPGLYGEGARLLGAMVLIDLIQITLQVLFIVDGLKRRAVNDQQVRDKPGRSLVTFLLICNLGLWLINTFMLKESYGISILYGYYGDLAWIIILNLTLPLAIYFRFHAAVCLSEIWSHAYKKTSLQKILVNDMTHCGKIL